MKSATLRTLLQSALILHLVTGCAKNVDGTWKAPFVYRIDVQQGNVVDQEMINKLKPGMDKNQVKFILGTPLVTDPFHSNRWDYIYSFEPGGGERQQRRITIYFSDNKLSHIDGDIEIKERSLQAEEPVKERSVDVPLERHEEGFFSKWLNRDDSTPAETATTPGTGDTPVAVEEFPADESATAVSAEPAEPEPPLSESAATDDTGAEEAAKVDESIDGLESETAKSGTEKEPTTGQTARTSTIESDQDKNLLRRFWDRMTSDKSESGVESGQESERDLRDAEVFKDAGGDL